MDPLAGMESVKSGKVAGIDPIEEMVRALTDPIIVFPAGGWEQDLPEQLKNELPLHRLAHIMRCQKGEAEWDEATDLEALLYMYPRTLAAPLGEQWTRIYLYLGTTVMGDKTPEDIQVKTLSDYDMGELRELKRWIRGKKVAARRARQHQEKAEKAKAEVMPEECEQIKLF